MRAIVLVFLVVVVTTLAAQGLLDFEGRWIGSCPDCAPGAMPGGLSKTLIIRVSGSQLSIQRDGYPAEVYRLDGTHATARWEDGNCDRRAR